MPEKVIGRQNHLQGIVRDNMDGCIFGIGSPIAASTLNPFPLRARYE
jgi:hypothetical protein